MAVDTEKFIVLNNNDEDYNDNPWCWPMTCFHSYYGQCHLADVTLKLYMKMCFNTDSTTYELLWTELHSPQNQYVEDLAPNMTIFRDRASYEVFKVKWGPKNGALIWHTWCHYKKREDALEIFLSPCEHKGKARWGHKEVMVLCNPGREALPELNPLVHWAWTSSLQNC